MILAFATPDFNESKISNETNNLTEELGTALQLARTISVTRGRPAGICASNDQTSCSGTWSEGWIVFIDDNRDGSQNATPEEAPVRVYQTNTESYVNLTTTHAGPLFFRVSGGANIGSAVTFKICPDSGVTHRNREIYISPAGSIIPAQDDNGDGIFETLAGANISCP